MNLVPRFWQAGIVFLITSAQVNAQGVTAMADNMDYFKVVLTLIFIVGLIFACAWLIRRMSGGVGMNQKHIQVISVMPLGTREKLMVIRAATEYLLIGVTPNGIQTLHRFDEPIDLNDPMQASPFADRLKGLLKGLDSDPLAKHRKSSEDSAKD
jgi:flagellar protein FliO/FliZ